MSQITRCSGCVKETPHEPFWKEVKGDWVLYVRCRHCDRQKRCPSGLRGKIDLPLPELARCRQTLFDPEGGLTDAASQAAYQTA